MRKRILGTIGVLWGGAMVAGHVLEGATLDYSSAYAVGQSTGLILGALMLLAGAVSIVNSFRAADPSG